MTREDLKNYRYNQKWIQDRFEYIEEYRTSIIKITSTLSDMPKSSRQVEDSMAENIAILLDNVNELMQKISEESNKQKRILDRLEKVEQPYRLILEMVYIQGKSLVTVASDLGYNYEYTKRMNGIALLKFDKMEG